MAENTVLVPPMITLHVDVSDLRQNLPAWLERVRVGEELVVTEAGAAVARLVPLADTRADARRALEALRARAHVGDVESPVSEMWEAADDRP
jgi:prevent-host-death family protein